MYSEYRTITRKGEIMRWKNTIAVHLLAFTVAGYGSVVLADEPCSFSEIQACYYTDDKGGTTPTTDNPCCPVVKPRNDPGQDGDVGWVVPVELPELLYMDRGEAPVLVAVAGERLDLDPLVARYQ